MGDFDRAERWSRRALEVNPYDTRSVEIGLVILESRGDDGRAASETFETNA